ncbi:MAG: carbohydrate porin [Bacteroidetes bacterium]|nr:carbohydrate porin [Bacteroidota bacterium]
MKNWYNTVLLMLSLAFLTAHATAQSESYASEASGIFEAETPGMDGHEASAHESESESVPAFQPTLTGNWGGIRKLLFNGGISVEGVYRADAILHRRLTAAVAHNLDLKFTFDLNELLGWDGADIELYALGNEGSRPSDHLGIAQPVSSIETIPDMRLYTAALRYSFFEGAASILLGLYDLNSEFCVLEAASPFLNSSFGIGPEIAQTGEAGPSIFPVTSAGVRLMASPWEGWTIAGAVLDGVPGSPLAETGTHVEFNAGDGVLFAAEIAHTPESAVATKLGIGLWGYTSAFEDLAECTAEGNAICRRDNAGLYAIAEGPIAREGISAFFRVGTANAHVNRFDLSVAGGFNIASVFNEGDIAAIGFSTARNGWKYRLVGAPETLASETVLEATYQTPLTSWLTIQPDIQLFFAPDGDAARATEVVGGLRISMLF